MIQKRKFESSMFSYQNCRNFNSSSLRLVSFLIASKMIFLSELRSDDCNKNSTLCFVIRYESEPSSLCCNSFRNSLLNVISEFD